MKFPRMIRLRPTVLWLIPIIMIAFLMGQRVGKVKMVELPEIPKKEYQILLDKKHVEYWCNVYDKKIVDKSDIMIHKDRLFVEWQNGFKTGMGNKF